MPSTAPLFPPDSTWTLPRLADLPSWAAAKRVAIDVETRDPHLKELGPGVRRDGYLVGVSFAIEDGPAYYLPFAHANGDNLDRDAVLAYLRDQALSFRGDLVGANLPYDLDYLLEAGIAFEPRFFRDVQVAEPLLDELQDSYSLQAIAERYDLPGKDEGLLRAAAESYGFDPKKDLWRLPAEYVGPYAERDVRLPLDLLRRQERRIDEEGLWPIYDLESALLPVLVRMRRRGVRVSEERLDRVGEWCYEREESLLTKVQDLTGVRVEVGDVWKAEAVARVLVHLGVSVPRTPKTDKPSVTAELLDSVEHDAARALAECRRVNKIRTTFVASIREHATNGRVHATFNQLRNRSEEGRRDGDEAERGARFGRLSSSDPNLQQQPGRDPELGPLLRSCYLPDEGATWACLDYSQQEPRWLTHYASLVGCPGAREAAEQYRADPSLDIYKFIVEACGIERGAAKTILLGKMYGMGGAKLCHQLGLPTRWIEGRHKPGLVEVAGDEGQALITRFDDRFPYARALAMRCEGKATNTGVIKTVLGRRCHFPRKDGGGYDWTHKALNRLIQGSSADQMKKALVDADAAGYPIQLQVHDELDLSFTVRRSLDELAEIMRDAVPATVPFRVDIETGPSWGELK